MAKIISQNVLAIIVGLLTVGTVYFVIILITIPLDVPEAEVIYTTTKKINWLFLSLLSVVYLLAGYLTGLVSKNAIYLNCLTVGLIGVVAYLVVILIGQILFPYDIHLNSIISGLLSLNGTLFILIHLSHTLLGGWIAKRLQELPRTQYF